MGISQGKEEHLTAEVRGRSGSRSGQAILEALLSLLSAVNINRGEQENAEGYVT